MIRIPIHDLIPSINLADLIRLDSYFSFKNLLHLTDFSFSNAVSPVQPLTYLQMVTVAVAVLVRAA